MDSGFYNLDHLNTKRLKAFYREAVLYGYNAHLEYCPAWTRKAFKGSSIGEFIDEFCSVKTHNVCIDRFMHSGGSDNERYGEVGFCTLTPSTDKPEFLYIFMTIDNLNRLVKKYDLKLR